MTVVALVQGFRQGIASVTKCSRDLCVADAGPARNIDRPVTEVVAVGDTAHAAIMRWAAIGACHLAPTGADLPDVTHLDRASVRTHVPCPRRRRLRTEHFFPEFTNTEVGLGRNRGRSPCQ